MSGRDPHDGPRKGARILQSGEEPTLVGIERYRDLSREEVVYLLDTEPEDAPDD